MPPIRFAPGAKSPATPSAYTDAQYRALDALKQTTPALKRGAARPEFVNHVMRADGSVSDDLTEVLAAAERQGPDEGGNIDEVNAAIAERRFLIIADVDNVPRIYFQCATPGNPDVELADSPPTEGAQ